MIRLGITGRVFCALLLNISLASYCADGQSSTRPTKSKNAYVVETNFYYIKSGLANGTPWFKAKSLAIPKLDLNQNSFTNPEKPTIAYASELEFLGTWGTLKADASGISWDGKAAPEDPAIQVMAQPKLIVPEGEVASLKVGQESLQYFEKAADGNFDLKTSNTFVGVEVDVTVTLDKAAKLEVALKYSVSFVDDRDSSDLNGLRAGKPIISNATMDLTANVSPGMWISVIGPPPNKQGVLVVLARVSKATPPK
jgi:hypothetical protein